MSNRDIQPPYHQAPSAPDGTTEPAPSRPLGWAIRIAGMIAAAALGVAAVMFWREDGYTRPVWIALGAAAAAGIIQTLMVTVSAMRRK